MKTFSLRNSSSFENKHGISLNFQVVNIYSTILSKLQYYASSSTIVNVFLQGCFKQPFRYFICITAC